MSCILMLGGGGGGGGRKAAKQQIKPNKTQSENDAKELYPCFNARIESTTN